MWVNVFNTAGTNILNASFNFPASNNGNGWYWVAVGTNQNLCCSAPGYYTYCMNTGTVPDDPNLYLWYRLEPVPAPPPPPTGNCWSA